MNTNIFICQLSNNKQSYIKEKIYNYLVKEDYDKQYINECITNVMGDRLVNIEDIISINKLQEVA